MSGDSWRGVAGALLVTMFVSVPSWAQDRVQVPPSTTSSTGDATQVRAPQSGTTEAPQEVRTLPNLSEQEGWPEPTADNAKYSSFLSDLLEGQRIAGVNALRWDFLGWYGGDTRRLWFRSEGAVYPSGDPGGEADVQVLYGTLISPFFDLQVGGRVEQHYERGTSPVRVFAVVGLQGLSPGRFEVEPALFLSNKGKVSGRFTASLDLYQAQRLVLQPRFETEVAVQRDDEFGVGAVSTTQRWACACATKSGASMHPTSGCPTDRASARRANGCGGKAATRTRCSSSSVSGRGFERMGGSVNSSSAGGDCDENAVIGVDARRADRSGSLLTSRCGGSQRR